MKKEVLDYVVEQTHALMNAASCSREAKEAAQAWLDAVGTENETEQTKKYVAELEADIVTVDALIGLAESETGAKIFGAERRRRSQPTERKLRLPERFTVTVLPARLWKRSWQRRMRCWRKCCSVAAGMWRVYLA